MKIGYILQLSEEIRYPPFNGPANHVRQVFQELSRRGHQVKMLVRLEGVIWKSEDLQEFSPVFVSMNDQGILKWLESLVRRIQRELKLPYLGLFESFRFAQACRQELVGFDLYYERFSWMNYGAALVSTRNKIPLVLEYNGDPLADLEAKGSAPRGLQRWLSVKIMKWALQQASYVVASGEGWRRSCINTWAVQPDKTSTVENGTELVSILSRDQLHCFRPLDESNSPCQLVYLGGFYKWHGIDILLRAMAGVIHQGLDLSLVMVGSGDGLQEAQELARDLGLAEKVDFLGRQSMEKYAPILANAAIGLSPYCGWEEFSGLKIFDYKAAGLACIASGKDGQPATLRHGETGWIVPPCDEAALAEAIIKLACDVGLRRRLGQAARLDAEKFHTWTKTAESLEKIFNQLIQQ